MVNRLLQDARVDPANRDNEAIRWASFSIVFPVLSKMTEAIWRCMQSNINRKSKFCPGFVQKIRQIIKIQKALEKGCVGNCKESYRCTISQDGEKHYGTSATVLTVSM